MGRMNAESSGQAPRRRITEIDALRGFALCGIHVVNVYQQVIFKALFGMDRGYGVYPDIIKYFFYERFFPIFTLLFGLGFAIFLESAAAKTDRPRVVLARRLVALAVIGVVHQLFHPGEALVPYAVFGLIFLLPASYLAPRWQLVVGIVLLLVGGQVIAGYGVMPGLLVAGLALAGLGVHRTLDSHTRQWVLATVAFGVVAVGWWCVAAAGLNVPRLSFGLASLPNQLAAVCTGMFYACLFILFLRTPPGALTARVLAPMGRMALTNYLAATAIILTGGALLSIDDYGDWPLVIALVAAVIIVEAVWSRLWLRHYRYGPFEWVWRCVTWWRRVPIRRTPR